MKLLILSVGTSQPELVGKPILGHFALFPGLPPHYLRTRPSSVFWASCPEMPRSRVDCPAVPCVTVIYRRLLCCTRLLEVHSALRLSALCSVLVSDLIARLRVRVPGCICRSISHHMSVHQRAEENKSAPMTTANVGMILGRRSRPSIQIVGGGGQCTLGF